MVGVKRKKWGESVGCGWGEKKDEVRGCEKNK